MSDILRIAVLAVGGQGGGVLSNWIIALAETNGYVAQLTSVAGVAQRTGATIYYIEMAAKGVRQPVFALSPVPGAVDVLIAAEIMEAGRAVQRGFVTPDRTTLVASTHRILAVSEKQVPGDGRKDGQAVLAELQTQAAKVVAFDLEQVAAQAGSMISASLFGALAQSGALPFSSDQFRAVIRAGSKGTAASLRAFETALTGAPAMKPPLQSARAELVGPEGLQAQWSQMLTRIAQMPAAIRPLAIAGAQKVVDYQDLAYGADYLDRIAPFLGHAPELDRAAAKHIANAMCYDDLPRVADLKTRSARGERLRNEQDIPDGDLVQVTEYFHPRAEEVCATLPARLGAWAHKTPWAFALLKRLFGSGRRVRTDRLRGYVLLWLVAGLRPYRRRLLRHRAEVAHLDALIAKARTHCDSNPVLAAEILSCQRLIKGYSDTHARGLSKFDKVMGGLTLIEHRGDAADWMRRLREAALQDVDGMALDGALLTVRSFAVQAG